MNPETTFNVYMKIARFVGANVTASQVCDAMRQPVKWMGSHDRWVGR